MAQEEFWKEVLWPQFNGGTIVSLPGVNAMVVPAETTVLHFPVVRPTTMTP